MSAVAAPRGRTRSRLLQPWAFLSSPLAFVLLLFVAPLVVVFLISLEVGPVGETTHSLSNYGDLISDETLRGIAVDTILIATAAMVLQLAIAFPFAYVMAFSAGRWEIPMLLAIVLADQLNPMIRIYAWRMLLGREGVINSALTGLGVIDDPLDILLFSKLATIVVMTTSAVTYTMIPIYGAMKAIDRGLFEAARDLGGGWWVQFRRILLPLSAPGVFAAVLLVYIPMFTIFSIPALVGGPSSYMLGNVTQEMILDAGDWPGGAALSFLLLLFSALVAVLSFLLARVGRAASAR